MIANMAIGWCSALGGARSRIEHTAIYGAIFFRNVSNTTHCMEYQQFPYLYFDGKAFVAWLGGRREGRKKGDTSRMVETIYLGQRLCKDFMDDIMPDIIIIIFIILLGSYQEMAPVIEHLGQ